MQKQIISVLLAVFSLFYFAFAHQLSSPSILAPGDIHATTLDNLSTMLLAGLVAGLGIWYSAASANTVRSHSLLLGSAIPVLLLLPSVVEYFKLGNFIPGHFFLSILCIAFYYSVLALKPNRFALILIAIAAGFGGLAELWHTYSATDLSLPLAESAAYRTIIIGTFAVFAVTKGLKHSLLTGLVIVAIGMLISAVLKNCGSISAIAAWSATLVLFLIGRLAGEKQGRGTISLALIIALCCSFVSLTGLQPAPILDSKLLSYSFGSFYSSGLTGHGYNTLNQAAIINNIPLISSPSLLSTAIYETGISGVLALALACWLFLRNSLQNGQNIISCLGRTATAVPFIVGTVCAANIASDLFILFSAVGMAAILERTSGATEEIAKESNFLKYQLAWFIPAVTAVFCLSGIFSLKSIENEVINYNQKSTNSAYLIYNASLPTLPKFSSPLFSVMDLRDHSKMLNFRRIFPQQSESNQNYISTKSRYADITNFILNSFELQKKSVLFNPFPEYSKLTDAETKFTSLTSIDVSMTLLALESYENIRSKLKTSTDPELMFAAARLCNNLAHNENQAKLASLLGYTPNFEECTQQAASVQYELTKHQTNIPSFLHLNSKNK